MQLIRGLHNLKNRIQHCAITIGNFDGLHLGHKELIHHTVQQAKALGVPSVLMTFEPQPNEFFQHKAPVPRLMRFREKWLGLQETGLDYVVCVRFDKAFAQLSPQQFIKDLLVDRFGMRAIVVGDDFRFGAKRAGDINLLNQYASTFNFSVSQMPTLEIKNQRVSSTRVREALHEGDLAGAKELLGQPYALTGKVVYGDQIGRQLGYPTANFNLHRQQVPLAGVFVVRAHGLQATPINGVANLGTRPAFNGTRVLLEVHLFDFNQTLYGKNLQIEFIHKLREERHYDKIDDLVEQIKQDVANAKNYFARL